MNLTFVDTDVITPSALKGSAKALITYRQDLQAMQLNGDWKRPEASLLAWSDEATVAEVAKTARQFTKVKHVVLIGIGGSSLGTEAVHAALATKKHPTLHVLDTASAFEVERVLAELKKVKRVEHVAVCVISKSGSTTETLANASVVLSALQKQWGKKIYNQTVFIGDKNNPLLRTGKRLGVHTLTMPDIVGGRYSVFSAVGLLPLTLLGHNTELFLQGLKEASREPHEDVVAEGAARLYGYLKKKYRTVNVFVFDTRLVRLAKWYRQLAAESLGKTVSKGKQPVTIGFVPTISTPVELHSTGQLFFSGFAGVYTDFISMAEQSHEVTIDKKTTIAKPLQGKSVQAIASAIETGVLGAYQTQDLPYRHTELEGEDLIYSLGLFMGMCMLETMYVAELMGVDAFDQPNVELYKKLTKAAL